MALNDITFQESNEYGSDFINEISVTSTGVLSDIVSGNDTYEDSFVYELRTPIVIVDNRRKIR